MLQLPMILTTDQPAASPEMPPSAAPAPGTAAASLGAPVAAPDASTVAKQRTELSRAVRMGKPPICLQDRLTFVRCCEVYHALKRASMAAPDASTVAKQHAELSSAVRMDEHDLYIAQL